MVLSDELRKFGSRLRGLWFKFLEKIAEHSSRMAKEGQVRNPRDRYAGTNLKDTQEQFSEFQKRRELKPGAEDGDLSKVLDDVLEEMPPGQEGSLYAQRRPKKP